MEEAREKYGALFCLVREVINRHDPIHIGYTPDEYEPEVVEILPRVIDARSDAELLDHVHRVFTRMFAPMDVGPRGRFQQLSDEIWSRSRDKKRYDLGNADR